MIKRTCGILWYPLKLFRRSFVLHSMVDVVDLWKLWVVSYVFELWVAYALPYFFKSDMYLGVGRTDRKIFQGPPSQLTAKGCL